MPDQTPSQRAAEKIRAIIAAVRVDGSVPVPDITAIIDAECTAEPAQWMREAAEEITEALRQFTFKELGIEPIEDGLTEEGEASNARERAVIAAVLARHRDAEVERLTGQVNAIKSEIAGDANFGRLVELVFYGPLREAEAELRRLKVVMG
ncbi:MAG: hypothetical protein LLG20_18635 [Acidobacteriales bacterium]|nr:hypothetical protein [Terriglobales bacterium]